MDYWCLAIALYSAAAGISLLPTLLAWQRGVELNPGGISFDKTSSFTAASRERLAEHFSRLEGTLGFWKSRAIVYTKFNLYCAFWTISAAWAIPLVGVIAPQTEGSISKWLLVVISSHLALALSFHKGFKVAEGMKSFRHGESEFYDTYRRLMDRPESFGESESQQIDKYFREVERIRRFVRNAEVQTMPGVDDIEAANTQK